MIFRRRSLLAAALGALAGMAAAFPALGADALRCTVVIDAEDGEAIHREGTCDKRVYPMSTFKLPLAMMGYDAGILIDETTPRWEYQQKFNAPKRVQKATDPTIWEAESVVWYSQELTRRLGKEKYGNYVQDFGYGNGDVSGGPGNTDGLTESWLMSSLEISPDEQVDFLHRFLTGQLPISPEAVAKTQAITPRFEAAAGWTIYGKTGAGRLRDEAGAPAQERPLGWFVGWAEKDGRRVVFARLYVANRASDQPLSPGVRDSLIEDLPGIIDRS